MLDAYAVAEGVVEAPTGGRGVARETDVLFHALEEMGGGGLALVALGSTDRGDVVAGCGGGDGGGFAGAGGVACALQRSDPRRLAVGERKKGRGEGRDGKPGGRTTITLLRIYLTGILLSLNAQVPPRRRLAPWILA